MSVGLPMVGVMAKVALQPTNGDQQGHFEQSSALILGGRATAAVHIVAKRLLERPPEPGQTALMHEPSYWSFATPLLVVELGNAAAAEALAVHLGAFRRDSPKGFSVPLSMQICISAVFALDCNTLQIRGIASTQASLSMQVTDRYAYFLSLTNNLSVNIVCGQRRWWITLVDRHKWNGVPSVAAYPARYNNGIIEKSPRWTAGMVSPDSMITDFQEIYTWTYGASTVKRNIPKLESFEPDSCVRCDGSDLNREHCTPKWMADRLNVEPVVGRIACVDCNTGFGRGLEIPVSALYAAGQFRDPEYDGLVYRWALKTALMLSAMSNIAFPAWLWRVVDGQKPPDTLHLFRILVPALPDGGYLYTVTSFPYGTGEVFACSFMFDNDMFLFVQSPDHLQPLDFLSDKAESEPLHEAAIRHYFGVELERGKAVLKPTTRTNG